MFTWLKSLKKICGKKEKVVSLIDRFPTEEEICSACLYFNHGFGLMTIEQRKRLMFDASEWLYAWRKVKEDTFNKR